MINTIHTALSGLHAASRKVDESATRIARDGAANTAEEAVTLSLSRTAFKANLNVLETASEMDKELLRTFDKEV